MKIKLKTKKKICYSMAIFVFITYLIPILITEGIFMFLCWCGVFIIIFDCGQLSKMKDDE